MCDKCILTLVWITNWFCQNYCVRKVINAVSKIIITIFTSNTFCSGTLWKEISRLSWVPILVYWWWIGSHVTPFWVQLRWTAKKKQGCYYAYLILQCWPDDCMLFTYSQLAGNNSGLEAIVDTPLCTYSQIWYLATLGLEKKMKGEKILREESCYNTF